MTIDDIKKMLDNLAKLATKMDKVVNMPHAEEPYYKFLYLLARHFNFSDIVELGVYKGTGIAHLYEGSNGYYVTGVDTDLSHVEPLVTKMDYVDLVEQDSIEFFDIIGDNKVEFGLFHVDTVHDGKRIKQELAEIFRVSKKAIICIDDIYINDGMKKFWSTAINSKAVKFEYPELHVTGYGVLFYCKGERSE